MRVAHSTRITSAPRCASWSVQNGPAHTQVKSATRMPASGVPSSSALAPSSRATPISASTSAVCSPSDGAGRRSAHGVARKAVRRAGTVRRSPRRGGRASRRSRAPSDAAKRAGRPSSRPARTECAAPAPPGTARRPTARCTTPARSACSASKLAPRARRFSKSSSSAHSGVAHDLDELLPLVLLDAADEDPAVAALHEAERLDRLRPRRDATRPQYGQNSKVSSRIAASASWIDTSTCCPMPDVSRAKSAPSDGIGRVQAGLECRPDRRTP